MSKKFWKSITESENLSAETIEQSKKAIKLEEPKLIPVWVWLWIKRQLEKL